MFSAYVARDPIVASRQNKVRAICRPAGFINLVGIGQRECRPPSGSFHSRLPTEDASSKFLIHLGQGPALKRRTKIAFVSRVHLNHLFLAYGSRDSKVVEVEFG